MARQPKRNRRSQDPSMLVTGALVNATVTSAAASTMAIALDRPCSFQGNFPITSNAGTATAQTINDLQNVHVTFSGTLSGKTFNIVGGSSAVRSSDGGRLAAKSGTF